MLGLRNTRKTPFAAQVFVFVFVFWCETKKCQVCNVVSERTGNASSVGHRKLGVTRSPSALSHSQQITQ